MSNSKTRSNKAKNLENEEDNNEILDIDLKNDYMDLIKAQNKKIQGLFSEIEKKDKLLSQYQIQLKTFENLKMENNYLKSQIALLTENFNKKSNSMKNFYEKKIEKLLEEIKEKDEINSELLIDIENIKKLLEENKRKYELIQKENNSNIEKVNKSLNSERDYESKAKELVNIIESQDSEIKKFTDIITELKNTINETKKNNDELSQNNQILQKKSSEKENEIINMNKTIEDLKIKLKNQEKSNDNMNKNYQVSIIKMKEYEKEIKTLKNKNNDLIKTMEKDHNLVNIYPKTIFNALSYFNTVMKSGYFWASTYIKPHSEYENLESIIADNGFILETKELINNMENNFYNLKNRNEYSNITKIIGEIYQEFVELIKNLYNEINEEFVKLNKIISNQKNGNTELISKLNNMENNSSRLQEEYQKTMDENKFNEKSLNNIKNQNSIINLENKNMKIKLQNYEQEIDNIYQILIDIIKSNFDFLNSNNYLDNIPNISQIEKENDNTNKLNIIKINLINFSQILKNSESELNNQKDIIKDYNKLKEDCKYMNKELIQVKKEYSILLDNYEKEKENMTNLIQSEKEKEIKIIKKEDFDKINNLNKIIQKKEEEIEKLSNDNNLLYQQYTLSQNNFEKYKMKRKKDDLNLQEKIEEMKKNIEDKNKEIKKYKNDNEIILNKTKIVQENLYKKNKENEVLQKQISALKKQKT